MTLGQEPTTFVSPAVAEEMAIPLGWQRSKPALLKKLGNPHLGIWELIELSRFLLDRLQLPQR